MTAQSPLRVALAGAGGVGRYFAEELGAAGIEVVLLTRSHKPSFANLPGVTEFVTDYSLPSLLEALKGVTTVISTILDFTPSYVETHLRLIEAARRTPGCTRFIPAEYNGNLEDYPDMPQVEYRLHGPIRDALAAQTDLEWTMVANGWILDYIVPARNRHLKDIGGVFPIDVANRKIRIPGTGKEPVDVTAVRDIARAVAKLVRAPKWERHTYMSGQKVCANELAELMLKKYPDMTVEYKSLSRIIEEIRTAEDETTQFLMEYETWAPSHAGDLDAGKVADHRKRFFEGVEFRTPQQLLDAVERDPDVIV